MEGENEGAVRGAGRRFAEDTTIGGVRRAARPPLPSRLLWLVLIVVCLGMAVFSVIRLVDVRQRRRRSVTSGLDETRNVTFPDVTVCDVRAVILALTLRATDRREEWGALIDTLSAGRPLNTQTEMQNYALRHRYQTLVDNMTSAQREQVGFNLARSLADCTLADAPCRGPQVQLQLVGWMYGSNDTGNFTRFYHHKYGNCYTFTPHPAHRDIWQTGPQHGLRLELRVNTGDRAQEEAGFVIGVHESGDTFFLPENGAFVSGGQATYLGLTKRTDSVDSDCVEDEERNDTNLYGVYTHWHYSARGCQHGCLQKELFSRCSCCDLDLPCPSSFLLPSSSSSSDLVAATRCNSTEELECRAEVLQRYTSGSLPCQKQCLPRCRQTRYSIQSSVSSFVVAQQAGLQTPPSSLAKTQLAAAAQKDRGAETLVTPQTPPAADTPPRPSSEGTVTPPSGEDTTTATVAPRVTEGSMLLARRKRQTDGISNTRSALIYVYFEDLRSPSTRTQEKEGTDWSEWMADVGGLLALWLGLSMLGLLEILHFFLDLIFHACCCRPKSNTVTSLTPQ